MEGGGAGVWGGLWELAGAGEISRSADRVAIELDAVKTRKALVIE
jgi:hypothetical protein